jgi:polysaccharide export outer membrane protein
MIAVTLIALLQLAPLAQQAPPPAPPGPRPSVTVAATPQQEYLIGVADVIDVTIFNEPDASRTGVSVDNDGTIDMPYVGRVHVAGKSPRAVETEIKNSLIKGGYLLSPTVSVTVRQYRSKTVSVQGYVRNPAEYSLQGNVSLTSVLAQAGSFSLEAGSYVLISRRNELGAIEQIRVPRRDIESGRAQDVFLKDGDTVLVPKAETIFINGYVRSPGSYTWEDGLTLERALALAGGLTERGASNRIEIRRTVDGKDVKISRAKMSELVLANDTIHVPQRIF